MKVIGRLLPGCCQGQQDDWRFPITILCIIRSYECISTRSAHKLLIIPIHIILHCLLAYSFLKLHVLPVLVYVRTYVHEWAVLCCCWFAVCCGVPVQTDWKDTGIFMKCQYHAACEVDYHNHATIGRTHSWRLTLKIRDTYTAASMLRHY